MGCFCKVQGGFDWLLSQIHVVPLAAVATVLQLQQLLVSDGGDTAENEETRICEQMQSHVQEHILVPTALGLRSSALTHKIEAFLHAVSMEMPDISAILDFLGSVTSVTSDMGTELGISHFGFQNVHSVLPRWMTIVGDIDNGDPDAQPVEPAAPSDLGLLMPNALAIPGVMHITTNLLQEVHTSMSQWDRFQTQLQPLRLLLCYKGRRERFIHMCVRASAARHLEPVFAKNLPKYHDKRWFSTLAFLRKLSHMLPALHQCWSEVEYMRGHSGQDGEDKVEDGHLFSAQGVSESLGDGWLYGYIAMVLKLDDVPAKLATWSEGCSCHEEERLKTSRKKRRVLVSSLSTTDTSCPMQGKRAPCLASGKHFEFLSKLELASMSELWCEVGAGNMPTHRWASLIEDFRHGFALLHSQVTVKFQFWSLLPWRLCSLGKAFASEEDGRAHARQCIELFESSHPQGETEHHGHHAVTLKFMVGELRTELDRWLQGVPLSDVPALEAEIGKLSLIPVCERIIEARGSQVSSQFRKHTHAGPVRASLALRLPQIRKMFLSDEDTARSFSSAWMTARNVTKAVHELHLAAHPEVSEKLLQPRSKRYTSDLYTALGKVIYHADLTSQYGQDLQQASLENRRYQQRVAAEEKLVHQFLRCQPDKFKLSEAAILDCALLAHAKSTQLAEDAIYSVEVTDPDMLQALPRALLAEPLQEAVHSFNLALGVIDAGDSECEAIDLPVQDLLN
eukprot:1909440-Amphidinium_carterae.4